MVVTRGARVKGWAHRALAVFVPLSLCALLLFQAAWFGREKSVTFDETFYLNLALESVYQGRLSPELAATGVAPLPVVIDYVVPALWTGGEARPDPLRGRVDDPPRVARARLINASVFGCGLLMAVYVWLARRRGLAAAAFATALLALSPTVVAHASLATTEVAMALGFVLALAALDRYWRRPDLIGLTWVAGTIALAISAKYSSLILLPIALVWVLRAEIAHRARDAAAGQMRLNLRIGASLLFLGVLLMGMTWLFHFPFGQPFGWPSPIVGILFQLGHQADGHPSFFLGEFSLRGWAAYLPFTFVVKSTPAELLLFGGSLILAVLSGRHGGGTAADRSTRQLWLLTIALFAIVSVISTLSIGHRYIFVLYPLFVLWSVDVLASRPSWRWRRSGAAALIGLQLVTAVGIAPHYLSYFNVFSGGPERAYRLLVDSNLDWGQDLIALRRELDRLEYRCVVLDYFGTAAPEAYGLRYVYAELATPSEWRACDYLAVSATVLHGVYQPRPSYTHLFKIQPIARAAHSILIYPLAELRELIW